MLLELFRNELLFIAFYSADRVLIGVRELLFKIDFNYD
jgi:hypothetical protein